MYNFISFLLKKCHMSVQCFFLYIDNRWSNFYVCIFSFHIFPYFTFRLQDKIFTLLTSNQYKEAVTLMLAAIETFPDIAVDKQFVVEEDDEEQENSKSPVTMDTMTCLKHIFLGR